jgi:hypothetical protein
MPNPVVTSRPLGFARLRPLGGKLASRFAGRPVVFFRSPQSSAHSSDEVG